MSDASALPKKTDQMAVAALVFGILGLVFLCPFVGSVVAVILGIVSHNRISKDATRQGSGLATGGIVTGAVGLLLVPLLMAIAIPTFLGARARAQDRAAEASIRLAAVHAEEIFSGTSSYLDVDVGRLGSLQPDLVFLLDGPSQGPRVIGFQPVAPEEIRFVALSNSGRCLALKQDALAGSSWARAAPRAPCSVSAFQDGEFVHPTPLD